MKKQGRLPLKYWIKPILFVSALIALFALWRFTPLGHYVSLKNVRALSDWAASLGWMGPPLFVLFHAVGTVLLIPGSVLGTLGGLTFGVFKGAILVSCGTAIGSSLAFLIARYLVRPFVERLVAQNKSFQKIDQGVANHGWRMVATVRLIPIFPYMFINYILGLTKIPFWTYVIVTTITMIPANVALCMAAGSIVSGGDDWKRIALYLFGAGLVFASITIFTGFMKNRLPKDMTTDIYNESRK